MVLRARLGQGPRARYRVLALDSGGNHTSRAAKLESASPPTRMLSASAARNVFGDTRRPRSQAPLEKMTSSGCHPS